ncbi:MAG: PDZ domain-containing protein [Planctomycetes bacterium]|nr:PDZ domain-containing protein [Planctomycetota bacterium]
MNRSWMTLAVVAIPALALTALAQSSKPSVDQPVQTKSTDSGDASSEQIEAQIRDLGAVDYVVRDRAYAALRKLGAGAKPELEKATKSEDPEIRWRAGRLLRALASGERDDVTTEKSDKSDTTESKPRPRALRRPDRNSDDDSDATSNGSNDNDPFSGMRDWPGTDEAFRRRMETLQRQMQKMQQDMDRMMRDGGQMPGTTVQRHGSRSTLRMDDNGVEATITENKDGKDVTETYKAKDLEDFKAKYPEVAQKLGLDHMQFQFSGPLGGGSSILRVPRFQTTPTTPLVPVLPRGDADGPRLGVVIQAPGADLAEHLGLTEGEGVLVREVVPDSLAAKLGIQKSDVLLELNGKSIGSSDDVHDALESTKAGGTVKAKILRHGEEKTLSAKQTEESTGR